MIKAIIFDCFGVLAHVNLWHEFLADLNDPSQVEQAKDLNTMCDAGIISRQDFLQRVKELTGKTLQDVETLSSNEAIKNTKLIQYVESLKSQGYKTAILSNIGSNWITEVFLTEQEKSLFDSVVLSFEEGITKPDAEIYKIACERLGVEPSEAVFTDDIEDYCDAARATGMAAIHYQDLAQLKRDLAQLLHHA